MSRWARRKADLAGLQVIDLRERHHDERLLRLFYRRLFRPAFPICEERESVKTWRALLWGHCDACELHCLVAGYDVDDPRRRRIVAGLLFEYYPISDCGLLTYLVTHPTFRRRGLATMLFQRGIRNLKAIAARRRRRLHAVFLEIKDPRKRARASDVMDPWTRLAFFERRGARILDLPYVQPPLEPGQGSARALLLLVAWPRYANRRAAPARHLCRFLREFYRALGIRRPSGDADFRAMMAAAKTGRVLITTLASPRRPSGAMSRHGPGHPSARSRRR